MVLGGGRNVYDAKKRQLSWSYATDRRKFSIIKIKPKWPLSALDICFWPESKIIQIQGVKGR